jgi:hypothetical protein
MGEITELILEGVLCETCGDYIDNDDIPGHPVKCAECLRKEEKGK